MAQTRLTPRELEALELLASGYTNQGMAEVLSISVYLVKKHISAIIQKLYARNRTHAAAVAVHQGLIRPSIIEQPSKTPQADIARRSVTVKPWEKLTGREMEILILLGESQTIELTNEALAQELSITRNTLHKHLRNMYKKLDAKSRAGLVGLSLEARRDQETQGLTLKSSQG